MTDVVATAADATCLTYSSAEDDIEATVIVVVAVAAGAMVMGRKGRSGNTVVTT